MKNFWSSIHANFNLRPSYFPTLFIAVALLLSVNGCQDEPGSIGLDLDRDLLNAIFTDSITLTAHSVLDDPLNTRNLQSNFLGFIRDPIFGETTTGIFTQFVPSGNSVNLGNSPQLDSVVLTLRYAGNFYGDTLNPFGIQIYRLTSDIPSSTPCYQNSRFEHSSENLTYNHEHKIYPKPKTKVKLDTIVEAHARIRLSDELGNLLLQNTAYMVSNEAFKSFFKGLYICATPIADNGSLVNFNLTSVLSGIQLYYKNDTVANSFQFLIKSTEAVRASSYQHDHTKGNTNFRHQVVDEDSLLGKEMLYIQCMGGVKTQISFPYIKEFKGRNVVINKAELVITNIGEELNLFPQPSSLNVYRIDKEGESLSLPDAGTSYLGGNYNETTKEYRFRITKYIQDAILKEDYTPTIYLVANRRASDANRLILSGTNPADSASRLRLELYYTEN